VILVGFFASILVGFLRQFWWVYLGRDSGLKVRRGFIQIDFGLVFSSSLEIRGTIPLNTRQAYVKYDLGRIFRFL
jgi:hypothetical protein